MENQSLKWMTAHTNTVYWNDSAIMADIDEAVANGATGITTNPFLIHAALECDPVLRGLVLGAVPKNLDGDERAEALTAATVEQHVGRFMAFASVADHRLGGVCAQLNPHCCTDTSAMVEQARRFARISKNICVKIPATRAGVAACEECAAQGMNVVATVSFTVAQAVAVGEAFQRGAERARSAGIKPGLGIAVIMGGRIGDYLDDVAKDQGAKISKEDLLLAGTAIIKRAYAVFQERGFEARIMPAAGRCAAHVADLAGADMVITISPKIARQLAQLKGPFEERIGQPVPLATIDRLSRLAEFSRAYEPDGLKPEEFMTFGALNRTIEQFAGLGWDRLKALR